MKAKNITGEDIKEIIDVFTPLIEELTRKETREKEKPFHTNPYAKDTQKKKRSDPPAGVERSYVPQQGTRSTSTLKLG